MATNLKRLRLAAGLTQDELSDRAKVAYSTVAKLEQQVIGNPTLATAETLARALNVSLDELVASDQAVQVTNLEREVRFVYTDVNGVMVRFYQQAFTLLSRDTGVSLDKVETVFWHYNDAACRGEITMTEFNRYLADYLRITPIDWQDYYFKAIEPVKEMHACIRDVARHLPVGLLTNTMPGFLGPMLQRNLIPDIKYAAIVDSSVTKAIKPERRIYEIAESKTGFNGDAILLLDDSRTNLIAAEKLGWRVMWFDNYNADESVRRIYEALAIVPR